MNKKWQIYQANEEKVEEISEKYKINKYEYDVLVSNKKEFKRKYDFKVIDKPTLDDIMLIYIKGEK